VEERARARLRYEAAVDEGHPKALRYLAERLAARREYLANLNVVLPPPSQQVRFCYGICNIKAKKPLLESSFSK
jgi:hypothetical protein